MTAAEWLAAALARRAQGWGEVNRDRLMLMRTGTTSPASHGGPSMQGRQHLGDGAFRRIAPPAP